MASKTVIALTLLLHASTSYGVKFHSYINEQGETVFSNVPSNCIQNSSLTCLQYHPVMSGGSNKSSSSDKSQANQAARNNGRPPDSGSSHAQKLQQPHNKATADHLDILDNIVEMNNLMNEYYPGKPDPADASRARQQQDKILDVLQVIRNTAGGDEQTTIQRAIDVLRSNLID